MRSPSPYSSPSPTDEAMNTRTYLKPMLVPFIAALVLLAAPREAQAHCDGLDGPVITDARAALAAGDLTPVLKWIVVEDEAEVRAAFEQTLAVRSQSPKAQELADHYFFETLVRLHRASEGESYTGLKPAGLDPGVSIREADAALTGGSLDALRTLILRDIEHGLQERFEAAMHARERADQSVEAGREAVHAYVEFVHYAKRLHENATSNAAHVVPQPGAHAHAGAEAHE